MQQPELGKLIDTKLSELETEDGLNTLIAGYIVSQMGYRMPAEQWDNNVAHIRQRVAEFVGSKVLVAADCE